ncbi:MAG: hypothetical protein BGO31_10000 [Bacteroidetes bacterium 43-16]|nr:MAG: hypothetical protein BGO31_10000 [Bacteroidetes bacterium 43-16]
MNKLIYVSTFLLITASLSSCGFEERKKALDAREVSLRDREQSLLMKEKMLTQLEDSIKLSIAQQDSMTLSLKNLGLPLPDSLQGTWNINMLCTQTSCSGSAVGDTRKESWTFSGGDSTGVYVKAMQGENLVRVYSGIYDGSGFILSTPNVSGDPNATSMNVKLAVNTPDKLSGTRIIQQADGCTITYKIDADRSKK